MKLSRIVTSAAIIATLALIPGSAFAQHGGGHGGGGGRVGGGARTAAPRGASGTAVGTAVPRGGFGGGYYRGYGWYGGGFGYPLGAPYYAFRPWLGLGFGLYLGYPIAYPYWAWPYPYVYGSPYPYAYGNPYGYSGYPGAYPADPNGVTAAPGTGSSTQEGSAQGSAPVQYGGLSFQITPSTARILVDGTYVGTVSQFGPTTQPLTLTPGQHHIEIEADGFQTMKFDVNVAPGQVIPYQGAMQAH